jgi:hypothetical protein
MNIQLEIELELVHEPMMVSVIILVDVSVTVYRSLVVLLAETGLSELTAPVTVISAALTPKHTQALEYRPSAHALVA